MIKGLMFILLGLYALPGSLGSDSNPFAGLWKGIDTFDGSSITFSISHCYDDRCDVRISDSFRSDTDALKCEPTGRFFGYGTGRIVRRGDAMVLNDLKFSCADNPSGDEPEQPRQKLRVKGDGVLEWVTDDEGYRANPILHKVSTY